MITMEQMSSLLGPQHKVLQADAAAAAAAAAAWRGMDADVGRAAGGGR